jgi:hypothetical protein
MTIESFAKNFVWDNQTCLIPAVAIAIPLAIEAINFAVELHRDPDCIHRKIEQVKTTIHDALHQRDQETRNEFHKRLAKNFVITVLALTAIGAAIVFPYIVLPSSYALPAALAAVHAVWLGLQQINKAPELITRVKNYLHDAFHQRPDETLESFQARKKEAIFCIVKYTLLFAAAVTAVCFAGHIASLLSHATGAWGLEKLLPTQTKTVVFGEYLAVGALHIAEAVRHFRKGNHSRAVFHLCSAGLSVFFPMKYLLADGDAMRLHHSFIGLILQLAPWRSVRFFGSVITFDSSLYFITPKRGLFDPITGRQLVNADFMNVVLDNFPLLLTGLTAMCLLQKGLEELVGEPKVKVEPKTKIKGNSPKRRWRQELQAKLRIRMQKRLQKQPRIKATVFAESASQAG